MKSIKEMFYGDFVKLTAKTLKKSLEYTFVHDGKVELTFEIVNELNDLYKEDHHSSRYVTLNGGHFVRKHQELFRYYNKRFEKWFRNCVDELEFTEEEAKNAIGEFYEDNGAMFDKLFDGVIELFTKFKISLDESASQVDKVFDVKYCDKRFAIIRINEKYREMYKLILYKLNKTAFKR